MRGVGRCRVELQHMLPCLPRGLPVATYFLDIDKDFPCHEVTPVMMQGHTQIGHSTIGVGGGQPCLRTVAPQHLNIRLEQQGVIHVLHGIKRALGVQIILRAAQQQAGGGCEILHAQLFDPAQKVVRAIGRGGMGQFRFQFRNRGRGGRP